jgi:serine O-acetyltransferase
MFEVLRRDAERYAELGGWYRNTGFWVGASYRFGVWARSLTRPLPRLPVVALHRVMSLPWRFLLNITIHSDHIGPGLCLIHPRNIMIGRGVEIGDDCLIFHEVTIGTGAVPGYPRLGDHVDVYVGARVLGGVTVGSRSMVGPNCVVSRDVPPDSLVAQTPNRVIPRAMVAPSRRAPSS